MENIDEIKENYVTPNHPTAFGGINRLQRFYNIKHNDAKKVLEEIHSYTLHREYKKPKKRNPYFIYRLRQQIQIDLIDIQKYEKFNNGTKYILCAIDCFSRYLWVEPLKNKTGIKVKNALNKIFNRIGKLPETIFCDSGSEIKNRIVKEYLKSKNVRLFHAKSELKAGIVERVNRTLQNLIYKYMTENETNKYIDKLEDLVETYNNRGHRTLKYITPADAEDDGKKEDVLAALNEHYDSARDARKTPRYNVGDIVRVKADFGNRFARGYKEQFTRELFKIVDVDKRMPIPMYILQSMEDDEIIDGGFYENELSKKRDDVFRIEKKLGSRMRNGRKEILVKWLDFSDRHNSWIPFDDVTRNYNTDSSDND